MKLDRFTLKAVFFLVAFAVYSASAYARDSRNDAPLSARALRFGQTIALSDFDSDGLIDEARLDGSGLVKRVGIRLSGSGERVSLHFGTRWINHGSLFAQDLDDDGAADLVWTDLLHDDSVIVWLGDGSGKFKRSAARHFLKFALDDEAITAPAETNSETEVTFENERVPGILPHERLLPYDQHSFSESPSPTIVVSSPALDQPTDRGPPSPLS